MGANSFFATVAMILPWVSPMHVMVVGSAPSFHH